MTLQVSAGLEARHAARLLTCTPALEWLPPGVAVVSMGTKHL